MVWTAEESGFDCSQRRDILFLPHCAGQVRGLHSLLSSGYWAWGFSLS